LRMDTPILGPHTCTRGASGRADTGRTGHRHPTDGSAPAQSGLNLSRRSSHSDASLVTGPTGSRGRPGLAQAPGGVLSFAYDNEHPPRQSRNDDDVVSRRLGAAGACSTISPVVRDRRRSSMRRRPSTTRW
jgi:hypothetical protein